MSTSSAEENILSESKKDADPKGNTIISPIVPIDHGKVEVVRVRRSDKGNNLLLDFPEDTIDRSRLPPVTIVTITRNRKHMAPISIDNWKRIYYPDDKLSWLVIDDSPDPKQDGFIEPLKSLKDKRILYYYVSPLINEEGQALPHTVGYKRNLAMTLVKTDIVVFMDDDDFLPDDSILTRVLCLKYYDKECIYSDELGIYDVPNQNSYILEGFSGVPEGSIALRKQFWERQKFGEDPSGSEASQMVSGQELKMLRIPYFFNLVVLNHNANTTGHLRSSRFKPSRLLKNRASVQAPLNLFKTFPKSFQSELVRLYNK